MSVFNSLKKSLGFSVNDKKVILTDETDMDDVIIPEQSFYEIILIKPKTIDDMDYVHDQIVEENNPVIVDLSYFEEEGLDSFQMAGEKIKILRQNFNAESILLSHGAKNMIIISPSRVKLKVRND